MTDDIKNVYKGLRSVIEDVVGDQLTTFENSGIPAIFQTRQKPYKQYPYITINHLSIKEVGGWLKNLSVDDNDNTTYTYEYQALFLITCAGKDAESILTTLKRRFSWPSVREKLYTDSEDTAVFQRSFDIRNIEEFLETDYEPKASLEITINFETTETDVDSTIIETVEIDGELTPSEIEIPTIIVP